jgi:hypothetical protein
MNKFYINIYKSFEHIQPCRLNYRRVRCQTFAIETSSVSLYLVDMMTCQSPVSY